jgi:hypothetical protein
VVGVGSCPWRLCTCAPASASPGLQIDGTSIPLGDCHGKLLGHAGALALHTGLASPSRPETADGAVYDLRALLSFLRCIGYVMSWSVHRRGWSSLKWRRDICACLPAECPDWSCELWLCVAAVVPGSSTRRWVASDVCIHSAVNGVHIIEYWDLSQGYVVS